MRKDSVIVTVRLPRRLVEEIDRLVDNGVFESRSDAIRRAISFLVNGGECSIVIPDEIRVRGRRIHVTREEVLEALQRGVADAVKDVVGIFDASTFARIVAREVRRAIAEMLSSSQPTGYM